MKPTKIARVSALTFVVTLVSMGGVGAGSASAASPWWHLASGARPSYVRPGTASSEVQKLTVSHGPEAGEESYILDDETAKQIAEAEFIPGHFVVLEVTAPASVVQEQLETMFGTGNVAVSGGPGGAAPYEIVFKGALADKPVPALHTNAGAIFTGFKGQISLTVATEGRADGEIILTAANLGNTGTSGPITITDKLPPGLEAVSIEAISGRGAQPGQNLGPVNCVLATLTCTYERFERENPQTHETEVLTTGLPPYEQVEVNIGVVVSGASSGSLNEVRVSGGGAPPASLRRPVTISTAPVPFGVENYELGLESEGGSEDTQAGSHPFQFTTSFNLNQLHGAHAAALSKDLRFKLPAGLIGNPTPFPQCTASQFLTRVEEKDNECPANTVVGMARITINEPTSLGLVTLTLPVFSLEPHPGEPARFGFLVLFTPVYIDTSVRTGGDYGIDATVSNISESVDFLKSEVTFWGVPGAPSHIHQRGWGCLEQQRGEPPLLACNAPADSNPPPLLEMPTSCTGPLQTTMLGDSWKEPGNPIVPVSPLEPIAALDGCNQLPFDPSINAVPDGVAASTPSGLNVDVHVPQDASLNPNGLADADVKNIVVTLPEGVQLNPAAADGLQACSEAQIGYLPGESSPPEDLHLTSGLPAPKGMPEEPFCPDPSKIATVTIKTPLLRNPLEGAVYLATPAPNREVGKNPFDSLIAMYLVAEDPVSGSLVKLPGVVSLDQQTGRITASFTNNPQLPFEDAELHFFGGDRAPLSTPSHCGTYVTEAAFTPWSAEPGEATRKSVSQFEIASGPNGGPCPGSSLPFAPSLDAGSTNINAGSFSPLTTTISRQDGNQDIQSVQLHMPQGLSGILKGVPLCGEAQANAGTCPAGSQIGKTIVSVGLGGDPFSVTGGQVFLTEGYEGAPFGLSIVNPAVAGPFDLGKVIVRAKIEVDPHTAQLTVTTGAIPHILDGIPLQIKHVNVTIDRPGFTFNPTNCKPLLLTGTIGSVEGASSAVAVPFQVTNCRVLKFAPKFSVSTSGRTSRAKGASLTAKLSYPNAAQGTQANIARVKVDLPKQLPSRLTTLQKACTNAQFELNPANCPAASKIGYAKVITPLLPVPLEGPAIFVSHGGEAFPSLTMVLQGYGVTVDLVGSTFISRAGITSTTFKTVPDTPFNTFTLTLPQGKYSALAANGNLCKSKLTMPTEFLAQNGLKINQSTTVSVTGCAKTRISTRARKLAAALKACHKDKERTRRETCEKRARKKYGPLNIRHKRK